MIKGVKIKADATALQAKVLAEAKKSSQPTNNVAKGLDAMETIMVKSIFEMLAGKYGIPATVSEAGGVFKISTTKELLTDYDLTLGWLAAIDSVPLAKMQIRDVCVGVDCSGGVEVSFDFGAGPKPAGKGGGAKGKEGASSEGGSGRTSAGPAGKVSKGEAGDKP